MFEIGRTDHGFSLAGFFSRYYYYTIRGRSGNGR